MLLYRRGSWLVDPMEYIHTTQSHYVVYTSTSNRQNCNDQHIDRKAHVQTDNHVGSVYIVRWPILIRLLMALGVCRNVYWDQSLIGQGHHSDYLDNYPDQECTVGNQQNQRLNSNNPRWLYLERMLEPFQYRWNPLFSVFLHCFSDGQKIAICC